MILGFFAGEDVGLAGGKMAATDPVTKQITVIVRVTGDVEMNGSTKNFITIRFDRCNLTGMLIHFDGDGRRELIGALRHIHFNHFGRGLSAVNCHHFESIGLDLSVRGKKSVCTEVTIVFWFFKIAAIKEACVCFDTVVSPFPYKRAHHLLIIVDHIPVFCDVTAGVAHCVCVFTHDEGTGFLGIVQHFFADGIKRRIHHADHIHKLGVVVLGICVLQTFIVNRSCVVAVLDVVGTLEECLAEGAFVAKGPDDNAGTVLVPFHESGMSVRNTGCKELVLCVFFPKGNIVASVTGAGSMGFQIGFIHDIDAKLVA